MDLAKLRDQSLLGLCVGSFLTVQQSLTELQEQNLAITAKI